MEPLLRGAWEDDHDVRVPRDLARELQRALEPKDDGLQISGIGLHCIGLDWRVMVNVWRSTDLFCCV